MGLFYQHNINDATRLGIWRIEEPEQFFLEKVPRNPAVTHPYKHLQHLAGRYLLPLMAPDFPLEQIRIADTRKPFLTDDQFHFSISHCGFYAAALISETNRVGVDIELVTPRIALIAPKFLHATEQGFLNEWVQLPQIHLQLLTILWSSKEAIFKWYGNGGVDFSEDIVLQETPVLRNNEWMKLRFRFNKGEGYILDVYAKLSDGLVLAYVVS